MPIKENEKSALLELKKKLQERYGLLDFRIFGSKARGEDSPDSDIDVMIKLPEISFVIESEIDKIIFSINLKNDCFITAVIFGKKELEEGPMDQSPLYKAIEREGITI
ncbi:MAG: hypothetical protein A3C43_03115 [Candidatus Schekmanbacteria bacterium RIFCSPHIGHO2_02_FULL_38_11]|uniref:Polymerase nucleotidyl transferase domain-containing protein n=1 Tax=Candidatus Schekmanbacteria bacterium RIFCSPLOWO2_12_FULL_38_15 TaxID=1817883 RepID=A0A1F7SED2_9BACT|nr:MAG: hypothetical protein A3H37_10370 [Candidatus Schekmanbacteria bacterium RIFCSPLOWO2_02_FULL_38_14]OGL52136.1 MAG: hypothetical protein A3G31_06880 [Candidatus Schekmanbacteria bacterium RIFCSPLOWO2_12_FULL_38_15]OGL53608.1 MAG: hypothetical protein A3C43_03115 [Candidatus Schekmanbacteria bacterium RIFCSPHIGHO2_02_FULL_38_11]